MFTTVPQAVEKAKEIIAGLNTEKPGFVVEVMEVNASSKVRVINCQSILHRPCTRGFDLCIFMRSSHPFPPSLCLQALDNALKQFRSQAPNTAVLLFSVDRESCKLMCHCAVSSVSQNVASE